MADSPLWRRAFDSVERPLGRTLDRVVQTGAYADLVATSWKLAARARRDFERTSTWALHLWNVPAATDLDRLARQVAHVERQVRDLSREVERDPHRARLEDVPEQRPSKNAP